MLLNNREWNQKNYLQTRFPVLLNDICKFVSISTLAFMIIVDFIFKKLIEIEISILNIPVINAA